MVRLRTSSAMPSDRSVSLIRIPRLFRKSYPALFLFVLGSSWTSSSKASTSVRDLFFGPRTLIG